MYMFCLLRRYQQGERVEKRSLLTPDRKQICFEITILSKYIIIAYAPDRHSHTDTITDIVDVL